MEKDLEGSGRDLIETLTQHFSQRTENMKISVSASGDPVKIRTEHLSGTSLQRYRWKDNIKIDLKRIECEHTE
jgi:hypothetical protein